MSWRKAGRSRWWQATRGHDKPIESATPIMAGRPSDDRAGRTGALGKWGLRDRLDRLSADEWQVFHDLALGPKRNLDHLVVGPRGIYSINARFVTGTVKVKQNRIYTNGVPTILLWAARYEAKEVAARLSAAVGRKVSVMPALAFWCSEWILESPPEDVLLGRVGAFPGCLKSRPVQMSLTEVSAICKVAHDEALWTPSSLKDGFIVQDWKSVRLYVKTPAGVDLGYFDFEQQAVIPQDPSYKADLERAVLDHFARKGELGIAIPRAGF